MERDLVPNTLPIPLPPGQWQPAPASELPNEAQMEREAIDLGK